MAEMVLSEQGDVFMKKLLLALAAAAVLLAAVFAVLYFRSPAEAIELGGENAPYPFTCEHRKRNLLLHITGEFPEGYRWTAQTESGDVLSVKTLRQTGENADFWLRQRANGLGRVTFTLEKEAALPDRIFAITCTFLLRNGGTVESAESTFLELPGLDSGTGEDFDYHVSQLNPYTLLLSVSGEGEWRCERVGVACELNGSTGKTCALTDSGASVHELTVVAGNRAGKGTLYVDGSSGTSIELHYQCNTLGEISLTGHELGSGDPSVRLDVFEEQYGDIGDRLEFIFGEGEQFTDRRRSMTDSSNVFPIGVIEFNRSGMWKVTVTYSASEEDLMGSVKPVSEATGAGLTANIYEDASGLHSVWEAEGMTFLMDFSEPDRVTCEKMTAIILETLFG